LKSNQGVRVATAIVEQSSDCCWFEYEILFATHHALNAVLAAHNARRQQQQQQSSSFSPLASPRTMPLMPFEKQSRVRLATATVQ
jgi:hypothetical protein